MSTRIQRHGTRVAGDESSVARRSETSLPRWLRQLLATAISLRFLLLVAFRIRCRGPIVRRLRGRALIKRERAAPAVRIHGLS